MMHFTAPHGLEQYSGAAWGTRDICQGPIELLLTLERDKPVKAMLRILFAQQYETRGDWPQWFMLEPYAAIQGKEAHGDVVVWPLKALCDYIEATGDFAFLKEKLAWRRDDDFQKTARTDSLAAHVERLIATVRARFIPGTHLIRYGAGDWNDSLQPVDPAKHDWMASSWTVALLYQQLRRYAAILRRVGRRGDARALDTLAATMREDFNRYLIRDGVVAGYGVFRPEGGLPELLLHPSDKQTGLSYSLLPMTQAILGDLFTPQQARRHLGSDQQASRISRRRAADGSAERLSRRPGGDLPPRRIGRVLRPRDRADVCACASALRRSDGGSRPLARAVGRADRRQPDRRHRPAGACVAAPAQRLFQQQRRRLRRSLSGERRMGAGQGGDDRGRWRLAHLFERRRHLRST